MFGGRADEGRRCHRVRAAPRYAEFPAPAAAGEHDLVVDVLAAGLHRRVRSQASGSHYTSTGKLPLVPGIDGVGHGADGELRYFVLGDTALGTMAEQTLIDTRRSVVLPPGTDPVAVAAAMNPAMSSWLALRYRTEFRAGQDVLIFGATGNSGRLAVQVARMFGARKVIAAGRDRRRLALLPGLKANETVSLAGGGGRLRGAGRRGRFRRRRGARLPLGRARRRGDGRHRHRARRPREDA